MNKQQCGFELSGRLEQLWSRLSDLDRAEVERLIAPAEALARSEAGPTRKRRAA